MGCSSGQGATTSACLTAQTFCKVNGQLVSNNSGISRTFTQVTAGNKAEAITINSIKTVLQNIYNYGSLGTRNPTQASINNIPAATADYSILLTQYNNILDILSASDKLSSTTAISASMINSIQTKINNYSLNSNRCNTCNTQCNAQCNTCQTCDVCNSCNTCQGCYGYTCTGLCQTTYECSTCHDTG